MSEADKYDVSEWQERDPGRFWETMDADGEAVADVIVATDGQGFDYHAGGPAAQIGGWRHTALAARNSARDALRSLGLRVPPNEPEPDAAFQTPLAAVLPLINLTGETIDSDVRYPEPRQMFVVRRSGVLWALPHDALMGDITPAERERYDAWAETQPHRAGRLAHSCGARWVGVWPDSVGALACPKCAAVVPVLDLEDAAAVTPDQPLADGQP